MRTSKKIFIILSLIFSIFLFVKTSVKAADISPDKYYIDVNNGNTIDQKLTIYANPTITTYTDITINVKGFQKIGESNDRNFYDVDPNNQGEAANWIKLDIVSAQIAPGKTLVIPWHLKPNLNVGCGTYLAAIAVNEFPHGQAGNTNKIGINSTTISQVHINIIKYNSKLCLNTQTNLNLVEFRTNSILPIFNYDNIPFLTRIQNNSSFIAQDPRGFIEMFGIGGKITIPFNSQNLDIYANSVRAFEDTWTDSSYPHNGNFFEILFYELAHFKFGQYEARLGVTNNVTNTIQDKIYIWIIPWRVMLVLLILLLILLFFINKIFISPIRRSNRLNKKKNKKK